MNYVDITKERRMLMKDIYYTSGIYRITNTTNDKSYIGKTGASFGDRWDSHRALLRSNRHDNPYLQNAWTKYGEDNFEFAVVETINDPSMLNELEIQYIKRYREAGLSYNIHDGGDGGINLGKHLSDETKRKIGEKNRVNMTGRKLSATTRKKMSEAQKRRQYSQSELEWRREFSRQLNTGRVRSEETKEKLRKINQDNPPSAKFTPDDIRDIRRKKADGYKLTELAEMYDTSVCYISAIVHRRRWAHIQ